MLFVSPYAVSKRPEGSLGLFGGVLLKPLKLRVGGWREGEDLMPGTVVPADVTQEWPLKNRLALSATGAIQYFQSQDEADGSAELYSSQVQENPTRAKVEAERIRRNVELGRPATATDAMAKARAAKALKRLTQSLGAEA